MTKLNGKEYDLSKHMDRTNYWTEFAADKLVGKKIVKVEYFSDKEAKNAMWFCRPLCFQLDDGSWLFPMRDDEGNDGGAMAYNDDTFPVLGIDYTQEELKDE